jgi:acetyl-CoA carboxylase biotin carboxyl carrier protein
MTPKSKSKPKRPVKAAPPRAAGAGQPAYIEELRALITLVTETGVSDLEVQSGGRTFRIGRNGQAFSGGPVYAPPMAPMHQAAPAAAASAPAAPPAEDLSRFVPIKSPLVGTFYRAPAPDADPYVEEGVKVALGQTMCIVEAMKLMNEIQAEIAGRVVKILVQDAQPVEFGQDLFLVDPGS